MFKKTLHPKPKSLQHKPPAFWIIAHWHALKNSIKSLKEKPLAFTITAATIAVTVALPVILYALLHSIQNLTGQWDTKPTIAVYLKKQTGSNQIDGIISQIKKYPLVAEVNYISPEEGLEAFNQSTQFDSITSLLEDNPLPGVINVTFLKVDLKQQPIKPLIDSLKKLPLVDHVSADTQWIQRLQYVFTTIKRIIFALSVLLAGAMVLVISNTVRLTAQAHREETQILTLIGATRAYIRRPFLYHGLVYGCCGGLIAWVLSDITLLWVTPPLLKLVETYGEIDFSTHIALSGVIFIVAIATLLSTLGSWIATRRLL